MGIWLALASCAAVAAVIPAAASAAPPANDNFAAATVLTGTSATNNGTTAEATREGVPPAEPDHCEIGVAPGDCAIWDGQHSVWYRWVAPASGKVNVDTCTAAIDSILAIYTGGTLGSLTRVTDGNNGCPAGFGSILTFNATAGTTYQIAVGDAGGATQNTFTLNVNLVPANDNFADAIALTGADVTAQGTTDNGTTEGTEPDHCDIGLDPLDCLGWVGEHSVWYRWTAAAAGSTTIQTCTAAIDSILAVYTGNALASLTRVADSNNGCPAGFGSTVTFNAAAGTTYRIAIGDAGGARESTFTLGIDGVAPPTQQDPIVNVAPETTISKAPAKKVKKKKSTFEFASNEAGVSFECSLNGAAFAPCSSPTTVKAKKGKNTFAVRARDAGGLVDGTPATHTWKLKKKKKKK